MKNYQEKASQIKILVKILEIITNSVSEILDIISEKNQEEREE